MLNIPPVNHTVQFQRLQIQRKIDTYALVLVILLFGLIAFISSVILALGTVLALFPQVPGEDSSVQDGMALLGLFYASMTLLSPLWLWLAFKARRAIGWPKNAFESVDFDA